MKKIVYITFTGALLLAHPFSCKSNKEARSVARETKTDSQSLQANLTPAQAFQLVVEKLESAIRSLKPTGKGALTQLAEVYNRFPGYQTAGTNAEFEIKAGPGCSVTDYGLVQWPINKDSKDFPVVQGMREGVTPSVECAQKFTESVNASIVGMQWFGATTKEFSRGLREYLPNGVVRFDYTNMPVVLGEGVVEESAKTEIEAKFQTALAGIPSVQVSVLPTIHFNSAGAAVCVSHSLFISPVADPISSVLSVKLDSNPSKDSHVAGGFLPGFTYLSRSANTTKAQLQPFLRQEFVASVFSSRNMAYSKLAFVPVFSASTAVDLDASIDDGFALTCEGAPNNQCLVLRGADVNAATECPIMSIKTYPFN